MGAEESSHSVPLPTPTPDFPYFCFSLFEDTIHLIYAGEKEIQIFLETIKKLWPPGIDHHKPALENAYKIVVSASPFASGSSKKLAILQKNMIAEIIYQLGRLGWQPLASSDLKRDWEVPTILMERMLTPLDSSQVKELQVIGISSTDSLQLVNTDTRINGLVKDAIRASWIHPIQKEKEIKHEGIICLELKMGGEMWGEGVDDEEALFARKTLTTIVETLSSNGLKRFANFNTKTRGVSDDEGNADTLFFVKDTAHPEREAKMFTMDLHGYDEIRMIDAPAPVPDIMKHVIAKHWRHGLKQDSEPVKRHGHEWHVMVLREHPWLAEGALSVESRILIMKVFEALLANGWKITASVDVSRKIEDMTTFVFEKCHPVKAQFCCMSFSEENKIRAINFEENVKNAMEKVIEKYWEFGIEKKMAFGRSRQWTLNGSVWDNNYYGKCLALHLLNVLRESGFHLISSADISAKVIRPAGSNKQNVGQPTDLHTWFFIRDPDRTIRDSTLGDAVHTAASTPSPSSLGPPPKSPLHASHKQQFVPSRSPLPSPPSSPPGNHTHSHKRNLGAHGHQFSLGTPTHKKSGTG